MKILKQGDGGLMKFTCPRCHCEFEAMYKEYKVITDSFFGKPLCVKVRCPCCQKKIYKLVNYKG